MAKENGKYASKDPSNYGEHPYKINLVVFCFNSSLEKLLFTFSERRGKLWEQLSDLLCLMGLAALWPVVACGDCWCLRLLLSVVGTGLLSSLLKSPYFCSPRGDGRAIVLQAHTRPGGVFFSRNMERTLMGKGVGRQTDCHFRGGKI